MGYCSGTYIYTFLHWLSVGVVEKIRNAEIKGKIQETILKKLKPVENKSVYHFLILPHENMHNYIKYGIIYSNVFDFR